MSFVANFHTLSSSAQILKIEDLTKLRTVKRWETQCSVSCCVVSYLD